MTQRLSPIIRRDIQYWWLFLLTGIILIGIGIWIFTFPAESYVTLSVLFAASMVVTGIFESIFALTARKSLAGWGWTLVGGIFDIAIGVYLLAYPGISMAVLPFILGFWLLFRGFSAVGFALDMRSHRSASWGLLLAIGILICFLGFMVLAVPAFGVLNIIIWTALSFVAAGIFRVILAFRLKKLTSSIQ